MAAIVGRRPMRGRFIGHGIKLGGNVSSIDSNRSACSGSEICWGLQTVSGELQIRE